MPSKKSKSKSKRIGKTTNKSKNGKQGEGGGQPTKYFKEVLSDAEEYLDKCCDDEVKIKKKNGKNVMVIGINLPSIAGLALHLNVNRDTLYEWSKKHKKFSDTLKKILLTQEQRLLNGGLSGRYNPTIAKLGLSTNHGYVEKTKDASGEKSISEILDEMDEEAKGL